MFMVFKNSLGELSAKFWDIFESSIESHIHKFSLHKLSLQNETGICLFNTRALEQIVQRSTLFSNHPSISFITSNC